MLLMLTDRVWKPHFCPLEVLLFLFPRYTRLKGPPWGAALHLRGFCRLTKHLNLCWVFVRSLGRPAEQHFLDGISPSSTVHESPLANLHLLSCLESLLGI